MHLEVDISAPIAPPPVLDNITPFRSESEMSRDYLNSGVRAAQNGDRATARKMLLKASELDPDNSNVWLWLASISEYPEELLVFVENVLAIDPANEKALQWRSATESLLAKTFVQRGIDAAESGQAMYAQDCFSKALEYDGRNPSALLWLASLSDNNEDRKAYLYRVLDVDPDNQAAQNAIRGIRIEEENAAFDSIRSCAAEGSIDQAIERLTEFTIEHPDHVDGWMLLSHLSAKPVDKLAALQRVLEIEPENQAARAAFESLNSIFGELKPIAESEPPPPEAEVIAESAEDGSGMSSDEAADDAVYQIPIAPPAEKLAFDACSLDGAVETASVEVFNAEYPHAGEPNRSEAEEDWNRDTESYSVGELEAEDSSALNTGIAGPDLTEGEIEAIPMPDEHVFGQLGLEQARTGFETVVDSNEPETDPSDARCPFCSASLSDAAFVCGTCSAALTLSDLEILLNNENADRDVIRRAVDAMESDRLRRPFDQAELTVLGIGHLNLRNLQYGFECLQEASRMNPDDIVLAGNLNSLLIRIEEIRKQEAVQASMPTGKKILVVDDSPTIRKLIASKLEKCGHEVYLSEDGVAAMEWLDDLVPDLVLLDITMPKMDGYEVCRQIRGRVSTANVPVLMISGKDGFFDKVRGRMAGTTGYITKPFGPETLMKAIDFYLGGGQDLDAEEEPSELLH